MQEEHCPGHAPEQGILGLQVFGGCAIFNTVRFSRLRNEIVAEIRIQGRLKTVRRGQMGPQQRSGEIQTSGKCLCQGLQHQILHGQSPEMQQQRLEQHRGAFRRLGNSVIILVG